METQQARAPHPPSSPTEARERAVSPASRWYYRDWLRVLAILTVFLYHVTIIKDDGGSTMIRNPQLDWGLSILARILELWGMPLFFVIAAVATFFSLSSRDNWHFLAERFKRLVIPFLLLGPPFMYLQRTSQGQFRGSFWQFLPHYFEGWYLFGGNFVWTGVHLWFLFLLFLFSLLCLPFFRFLKRSNLVPAILDAMPRSGTARAARCDVPLLDLSPGRKGRQGDRQSGRLAPVSTRCFAWRSLSSRSLSSGEREERVPRSA